MSEEGKNVFPYAGIQTFLGREYRRVLKSDEDIIIVGVPLDTGASYKPGTRFGPAGIRKSSMILKFYSGEKGLFNPYLGNVLKNVNIVDYGDLEIPFGDLKSAMDKIYSDIDNISWSNAFKIFLGGDHSITYPLVKAIYKRYNDLKIVHIDAHLDILPSYGGVKYTHASPIYRIINDVGIKPDNIIQLGMRGYVNSVDSYNYAKEAGVKIYDISRVRQYGLSRILDEVIELIGESSVYITFDIDSLDPSIAPGTGVVEPGGFTYPEASEIIRRLGKLNVVAADFVEYSPELDVNDITGKTITYLILDLISSKFTR